MRTFRYLTCRKAYSSGSSMYEDPVTWRHKSRTQIAAKLVTYLPLLVLARPVLRKMLARSCMLGHPEEDGAADSATVEACSKETPSGMGRRLICGHARYSAKAPCAAPKTRSEINRCLICQLVASPPRLKRHPGGIGDRELMIPANSAPSMKGKGGRPGHR